MEKAKEPPPSAVAKAEAVRVQRLREDAQRPIGVNLAEGVASGEQVAIEADLGHFDIVQGLDGVPSYEELRPRATEAEVLSVTVAVCSKEDLKTMKRAAGRTRDLADLRIYKPQAIETAGSSSSSRILKPIGLFGRCGGVIS